LQSAMLIWEYQTRGTANRTALTLTVLVGLYIGASFVMTRSPINFIATGMTLDSWTGYYRLQIWEHGLDNVYANPWTGIGLGDWVRPWWMVSSTVDAFWLVIAMREGIPGIASLLIGVILTMRAVVKRGLRNPEVKTKRLARGWIMSLIALSLVGCTVHFWNVLYAFFFFFIGLSGWIADPARRRAPAKASPKRYVPTKSPAPIAAMVPTTPHYVYPVPHLKDAGPLTV
jgi:O-antigen ligase